MSFGSILIMCLLCFAIGGQDRLLWTTMHKELVGSLPSASEESIEEAPPEVAIAGLAAESDLLPEAHLEAAGARPEAAAAAAGEAGGDTAAIACAAGFTLALPPPAPLTYSLYDWMTEGGRTATMRYETAGGGVLELTQTIGTAGGAASELALPLPRHPAAAGPPTFEAVWQGGERTYALRAFGVKEQSARRWMSALEAPAGCPAGK